MELLLRIWNRFTRIFIDLGVHSKTRQVVNYPTNSLNPKARILVIGPGEISIPTQGWGAVETVIEETITLYLAEGYSVTLLNSNNKIDWSTVGNNYDIILNHNDRATKKIRNRWKKIPLITFSHYGLGQYENLWNKDYRRILLRLSNSDFVICLNERIKDTYSKYISVEKLIVSPNGSDFMPAKNLPTSRKFVCVGKVESRKRQYEVWNDSVRESLEIDFIGPISDTRVENAISQKRLGHSSFLGPMTRKELSEVLSRYRALILPSIGEADALVLYEAQLAGLPVFVTENGLGAQDLSLRWIRIIPFEFKIEDLEKTLDTRDYTSLEIALFAESNYRWSVRHEPVLSLLRKITNV